jgi:anti-sigma-K factor RskA
VSDIDVHHLAAAYALDALDHHEREAFEAHYESCEVCRGDVLEFRDTMTHVAASLAAPPPSSLKARVMAEVAVTRQLSPSLAPAIDLSQRRRMRTFMTFAAAAAAVLVIVVGVVVLTGRDDTTYSDDLARVMEQPDARMIDLENKSGFEGSFKVAWSGSLGEAVLIGENLPPAPDDKAYELWLVTPDETMAMYVLDPAKNGTVHRSMTAPAEPSAWAITMEPKAGTPVATGDIIYVASV